MPVWLISLLSKFGPIAMQYVTGINIGAIFDNVKKYWRFYLPILLVSLQLFTAFGWYRDHNSLQTERAGRKADQAAYTQAQKDAEAKIVAKEKELQQRSKALTDEADKNYSALLTKYRASLLRYQAAQSTRSGPSSGQFPEAPEGLDGPSEGAKLSITLEDAQICADNTARLVTAHNWALELENETN